MTALSIETLQERIAQSELGEEWLNDPLMQEDIWPLTALGFSEEECRIQTNHNVYFNLITLPWLKVLTKLTVKAQVRNRVSIGRITKYTSALSQLNAFLMSTGHIIPESITDTLLKTFIGKTTNREWAIRYAVKLWTEEEWLTLPFTPVKRLQSTPKVEIIPEQVLHQIYENLDLFPAPLQRLFRLQMALGCRISEIVTMPRQCLKREGEQWFLLRWIAKRKHWRHEHVHSAVAEVVQAQQKFLNAKFGADAPFDKLFCRLSTATKDGVKSGTKSAWNRFKVEPVYQAAPMAIGMIQSWLQDFSNESDLKDKYGNPFKLTSHMFRRTKASLMANCGADDEYIAVVLGHGSLDMLPHYRKRPLDKLEKEAQTKGYVDMHGNITTHKPRRTQYKDLRDLLKVSTPLGECHRPAMLGDCQSRYACLNCQHHRVTEEDRAKLKADHSALFADIEQAREAGQQRRVTEIEQLLMLIGARLNGLDELKAIKEDTHVA